MLVLIEVIKINQLLINLSISLLLLNLLLINYNKMMTQKALNNLHNNSTKNFKDNLIRPLLLQAKFRKRMRQFKS
jgi:hypothetical protein